MLAYRDDLLLKLYGTVQQPDTWRQVLDQICANIHVRSAVVQRLDAAGPALQTTWLAWDSHSEEHAARHAPVVNDAMNPRFHYEYAREQRIGNVGIACDEDLAMPAYVRRQFQDDLGDVGLGKGIFGGTELLPDQGVSLILHRYPGDTADYSSQERAFVADIVPHVAQALRLADQLQQSAKKSEAMERLLDRVRPALVICDDQANVIWANHNAQQVIKSADVLKVIGGRICSLSHDRTQALHALIRNAAQHADAVEKRCVALDDQGLTPTHLMVMPLQGGPDGRENRVALLITRAARPFEIPAKLLEKLFRLSPAEARLSKAIVEGGSVNSYALINGLAEGTVRFQLKQVLAKTGSPRQSDLVRLICSTLMGQFGL